MADTFKELRDKIDSSFEKLSGKLEQSQQELRSKIDKNVDELSDANKETATAVASVEKDVATITATISSVKTIGIVATIACAILGSVGVWQIVRTQLEIKEERERFQTLNTKAEKLIALHGNVLKGELIEKIEAELNSEAGLDNLKGKPQTLQRITSLSKSLEDTNKNLDAANRTDYYKIDRALSYFLSGNCDQALIILESFRSDDQDYFSYAYMRAACLYRTGRPDGASSWFKRAEALTGGKRIMMIQNAQGVVKLAKWKLSKDQQVLNEALSIFSNLKKNHPEFSLAYINLACVYSELEKFDEASQILKELRKFESVEYIVDRIHEDVTRDSDRFLLGYVRSLKIGVEPSDPSWKRRVREVLPM